MRNALTLRSASRPPPAYRGALTRLLIPILATALSALACSAPTKPTPSTTTYSGSFSGEEALSSGTNGVASCAWRMSYTGTMKIALEARQDGTAPGTADVQTTQYAVISQVLGPAPPDPRCFAYSQMMRTWTMPVTGTPANLAFTGQRVDTQNGTSTTTLTFSGALSAGVITGMATYTESNQGGGGAFSSGSATFPVTLR